MTKNSAAWSRLTAYIEDAGSDNVLEEVCSRIAEGETPMDIARSKGLTWMVLKMWLEGTPDNLESYEAAKRAYADKLAWDAVGEAQGADIETVGLAKMRADVFTKHAGFHDSRVYGAKTQIDVQVNTVDIRGLLELREQRLRELAAPIEPLLLEAHEVEVMEEMEI